MRTLRYAFPLYHKISITSFTTIVSKDSRSRIYVPTLLLNGDAGRGFVDGLENGIKSRREGSKQNKGKG